MKEMKQKLEQELAAAKQHVREVETKLEQLKKDCPHKNIKESRGVFPAWGKYCTDCGKNLTHLRFVWNGWYDAYESCNVPTLVDETNAILWQGGHYYGGEVKEKITRVREELQSAAKKYQVSGYDFSSNDINQWKMTENRKPT
jgi:DNA repair exonuclease SbcCD ATPase subunit